MVVVTDELECKVIRVSGKECEWHRLIHYDAPPISLVEIPHVREPADWSLRDGGIGRESGRIGIERPGDLR